MKTFRKTRTGFYFIYIPTREYQFPYQKFKHSGTKKYYRNWQSGSFSNFSRKGSEFKQSQTHYKSNHIKSHCPKKTTKNNFKRLTNRQQQGTCWTQNTGHYSNIRNYNDKNP